MSATLTEGTVFAHRYRVVRPIAAGAMGAVYEVVHLETDRRRALKVMHPHFFQSDEMRQRFQREARIAANIESEFIVDVSDAGIDEATRTPFLVMELLRGEELGERLKRLGRLPPAEVLTYLHQTALALDRTHAASIVHRDLKPANLFLSQREDGSLRVKILDFGVAKLVAEGATAAGATSSLGTPIYMAPEQFRTDSKLTGAVDIYALGMMAYTLLVGAPYWAREASGAGDVIAFALVAIRGPEESPVQRALAQGVVLPPSFDAWFAQATAVDPAARFRSARVAVRALGEVLGLPVDGGLSVPFQSSPSWPAVAPPMAAAAPVSAPGFERHSFPQVPALAATSTGAAVSAVSARPSRAPLFAVTALLGAGVLAAFGWLALRTSPGSAPAAGAPLATAAPGASAAVSAEAPPPARLPEAPPPAAASSARGPTVVPASAAAESPPAVSGAPRSSALPGSIAQPTSPPPVRAAAGTAPPAAVKAPPSPASTPASTGSLFGRN